MVFCLSSVVCVNVHNLSIFHFPKQSYVLLVVLNKVRYHLCVPHINRGHFPRYWLFISQLIIIRDAFFFSSVMFILFSFVFVFMSRFPISGAIMFASPHFRRERFEPGCSDGSGSPGTGPTQAAAAPVICCLRTPSTPGIAWPKRNRTTPSRCQPSA